MVLSAPRSGSSWASNWLTTEHSLCLHDPVLNFEPEELDNIPCQRTLGVACTGLALFPQWVNYHKARKIIVHRDRQEIDKSLLGIGLTPLGRAWDGALERIEGRHVQMEDLFNPAQAGAIFSWLTGQPFDYERHRVLLDLNVQPQFDRVHVKADAAKGFARRVREAIAS